METSMEISIYQQIILFLGAGIVGIALGAVYDVFRILRLAIKPFTVIVLVQDIVFFFLFTVVTFFYILIYNDGHIRVFVILGEIMGFSLYYFTVGALVMKVSKAIIQLIKFLLKWLFKIFIMPFVLLFKFIAGLIVKLLNILKKIIKKPVVKTKIVLKQQQQILYNLFIAKKSNQSKNAKKGSRKK